MKPSLTLETTWRSTLRAFCLGLVLLGFLQSLRAQQFGLFSYQNLGDAIEITGYPRDAVGAVEIPAVIDGLPVTSIGFAAFLHCAGLTSVTIPSSVTIIRELDPDSLPHLEEYWGMVVGAFAGCTGLTNMTLPSSLTSIGDSMLAGCTGLTSITLEQGLTTIGSSMLAGCTGLTSVTIPASVTSIGEYAFSGCTGLTSVTLEQGLKTIGHYMFSGCTALTNITLPSSITDIGWYPFSGCTGLASLFVKPGNTVYSSVEGVLFNAAQTALVHFPQGKAGHYGIPSSVTSIGHGAFASCTGLTSITLPGTVTSIGGGAFSNCIGLTSITIPSSVTNIADYAFSGCTGLTSVSIPSSVTRISDWTFSGCTGLTNVSIPNSVISIGSFLPPPRPDPNYSGPYVGGAFAGCTGLTSVTLPNSLTYIGYRSFAGCTGLSSVTIPAGVRSIDYAAFAGCTGLASVTLPSSVLWIGDSAFSGCTGLESFSVEPGNTAYASDDGVLLNAAQTELIQCPAGKVGLYTIPTRVTSIRGGAFYGCTGLTGVNLPSSVTSIGRYAFWSCTGLTSVTIPSGVISIGDGGFSGCTGLTSVNLPSNLTSIGWYAFSGCAGLTNVILPASLTSIGHGAFYGCTGLGSFVVEPGSAVYSSVEGVLLNAAQTAVVSFPQGKAGHYGIPSSVTNIGEGAFYRCTMLTSVTIPSSVTSIDWSAFAECTALTSVTLSASVTYIGWSAFSGCTALTTALFLGDAPAFALGAFGAAPGFTIYYLSSRAGFTSPTWNDYPATRINEATYPAAAWLLTHGLWYDSDLRQDPDGDGVNLLTAYALNLDPRLNLQGRLPGPVLGANTLSLNFHASSPGITFRVETSTNLTHWTTTGVTQTAPGADGRSTASVLRDAPQRFLRLLVQD